MRAAGAGTALVLRAAGARACCDGGAVRGQRRVGAWSRPSEMDGAALEEIGEDEEPAS